MATSALVPVQFNGATLTTTTIDGVPYVAVKPICEALSVNWVGQLQRIKRHPVLNQAMCVTHIPSSGGEQQTVLLPLDMLNGWLFGISPARVRDAARRALLVQYQRECFDVLARHFGTQPAPALQTHKPERIDAPQRSASQVSDALTMGLNMAAHVQRTVARAMAVDGADWANSRWVLSFIPGRGTTGPVPLMELLPADAQVMSQDALSKLMADAAITAWHNVLGNTKTNRITKD